jgi:hypothetical protein
MKLNKKIGRHDTQHNDTQHNDTQHNDTQHNVVMLNAIMVCFVTLSVALLNVVKVCFVMLSVVAPKKLGQVNKYFYERKMFAVRPKPARSPFSFSTLG